MLYYLFEPIGKAIIRNEEGQLFASQNEISVQGYHIVLRDLDGRLIVSCVAFAYSEMSIFDPEPIVPIEDLQLDKSEMRLFITDLEVEDYNYLDMFFRDIVVIFWDCFGIELCDGVIFTGDKELAERMKEIGIPIINHNDIS